MNWNVIWRLNYQDGIVDTDSIHQFGPWFPAGVIAAFSEFSLPLSLEGWCESTDPIDMFWEKEEFATDDLLILG